MDKKVFRSAADVRRAIVVGVKVKVERYLDGVLQYRDEVPRIVVHVQSNSFCLASKEDAPRGEWGWMDWPKASELSYPKPGQFAVDRGDRRMVFSVWSEGASS